MADEYGWLIETKSDGLCSPVYWDGERWTRNHLRAVRFCRAVDAERIMVNLPVQYHLPNMKAVEHGWMDSGPNKEEL